MLKSLGKYVVLSVHLYSNVFIISKPLISHLTIKSRVMWEGLNAKWMQLRVREKNESEIDGPDFMKAQEHRWLGGTKYFPKIYEGAHDPLKVIE
jgi:hypothetical protein